jgi:hypothetical protein
MPSAGFMALATVAIGGANAASIDGKFNAALNRMLMGMKDGPVSQMSAPEKKELVACVQKVFGKIPDDKKRYIVDASGEAEVRARFDEVGLENRAALKQEVRDECA